MKKMHPLLLAGAVINLLYAAFLSYGWFSMLTAALPGALAIRLFSFLEFLLWFGLGMQIIAIVTVLWIPRFAFALGVLGTVPYFPIGLVFLWGLRFTQYEAQYALFEKTLSPPSRSRETLHYAQGTLFLACGAVLVLLAAGSLYMPFVAPLVQKILAGVFLFLAIQAVIVGREMRSQGFLYVLQDKLAYAPVLGKPIIYIPFTSVEKFQVTEKAISLTLNMANTRRTLSISLAPIAREKRMETTISMRHLLAQATADAALQ